jgi:hypothetical protein
MFLRSNNRKKDGKDHRYFSIVENHRLASNKTVQRTVLYLGEINDEQQAAWRKTLSVFDEEQQDYANLSLFPDDREIPGDAVDSLQVRMSGLELRRPRLWVRDFKVRPAPGGTPSNPRTGHSADSTGGR